jgi:hypothetical protein
VEEEGDDEGGVYIDPVVVAFGAGEGGVAFEETLVHFIDIHCFGDWDNNNNILSYWLQIIYQNIREINILIPSLYNTYFCCYSYTS